MGCKMFESTDLVLNGMEQIKVEQNVNEGVYLLYLPVLIMEIICLMELKKVIPIKRLYLSVI